MGLRQVHYPDVLGPVDAIVTVSIGARSQEEWTKFALPSWLKYCRKHELALFVFDDYIDARSSRLPPAWQRFLVGDALAKTYSEKVRSVCYLDTDILINPFSPNIFSAYVGGLGVVSQWGELGEKREEVLRRVSFLRHIFISQDYPLDSVIFRGTQELFRSEGLPERTDYFCGGVFLFGLEEHSKFLRDIYHAYDLTYEPINGADCEVIMNHHFQELGVQWFSHKFQRLWLWDVALIYPFLYQSRFHSRDLVISCLQVSLMNSYFLHFAGSWPDTAFWKQIEPEDFWSGIETYWSDYECYKSTPVSGVPRGYVRSPYSNFELS